jgi:hypothetical protein
VAFTGVSQVPWHAADNLDLNASTRTARSDLGLFTKFIAELSEHDGCCQYPWRSTALQPTDGDIEGFRDCCVLLRAVEERGPPGTFVIAVQAYTRYLVLGQVDKRCSTPGAECFAPASNAVSAPPDAVPALRRTRQGRVLHFFPCVAARADNPLHQARHARGWTQHRDADMFAARALRLTAAIVVDCAGSRFKGCPVPGSLVGRD